MDNLIHKKLKDFGFTTNESSVYLVLVEQGKMKAGDLIHKTALQRSAVYGALGELVERGFVTKLLVGGVAVFSANDPLHFLAEAERKKASAAELAELMKGIQANTTREVHMFEGIDAVKRATDALLSVGTGDTFYFLGSSKAGSLSRLEQYWQKFHKKRITQKLASKILYDRSTDKRILDNRNKLTDSEAKYMPFGEALPLAFTVRGDRLVITAIDEVDPVTFTIRSKAIAGGMQEYFEYLWGQE